MSGYLGGYAGGYLDWTYLILVIPALIITLIAQLRVKSVYNRYASLYNSRGLTGYDAASRVLSRSGVSGVTIGRGGGSLSDHYDPASNSITLSDEVYGGSSIAAVGVAAHEAGHAVQYAESYGPIRFRTAMIPVTSIAATVSTPLIILGYVLSFGILVYVGIALFSLSVVFQLVTLPIELNASRRAIAAIEDEGLLFGDELAGTKKVLRAAAFTYLAALLMSFVSLLRLILIFGRKND